MTEDKKKEEVCVLCGRQLFDSGNNAEPLAHGRCCDRCNDKVISARLTGLRGKF